MALEKIDIETLDPQRTIVVATGNAHKLTEIEAIFSQVLPDVRFVALGQLGDFEDPEENGTTFVENAIIKAEAAVAATGLAAIADDSGLERTIVVATGNAHKLTEIEAIFSQVLPDVRFVALGQLGDFEDPEENGTTFVENAIIKAEAAVAATGLAAIADDSGLVVAWWWTRSTASPAFTLHATPAPMVMTRPTTPSSSSRCRGWRTPIVRRAS